MIKETVIEDIEQIAQTIIDTLTSEIESKRDVIEMFVVNHLKDQIAALPPGIIGDEAFEKAAAETFKLAISDTIAYFLGEGTIG